MKKHVEEQLCNIFVDNAKLEGMTDMYVHVAYRVPFDLVKNAELHFNICGYVGGYKKQLLKFKYGIFTKMYVDVNNCRSKEKRDKFVEIIKENLNDIIAEYVPESHVQLYNENEFARLV